MALLEAFKGSASALGSDSPFRAPEDLREEVELPSDQEGADAPPEAAAQTLATIKPHVLSTHNLLTGRATWGGVL